MTKVITVSREFGSGGRELGKRLADTLGYAYYDKEILEEIAKQTQTSEWYVERMLEGVLAPHVPLHYGRSFSYYSPITHQAVKMLVEERNVIRLLAAKGNCVIVGRCADYILKDRGDCLHVFVHAPLKDRAERIVRLYGETSEKPEKRLMDKDKKRSVNYRYYTDREWGLSQNYHLCLDSSEFGIEGCVDIIVELSK